MIGYIKGELADVKENYIVVEAGNIGYEIFLPVSSIEELPPRNSTVKIYTYLQVREDALCLYGFLTKDELEMFKLLITVNGIGPKGALGVLSSITADELKFAILAQDSRTIAKAQGIGKKTAEKIILELKDKIRPENVFGENFDEDIFKKPDKKNIYGKRDEAVQALVALGYTSQEAYKIISQIDMTEDMTTEDILKLCLKKL